MREWSIQGHYYDYCKQDESQCLHCTLEPWSLRPEPIRIQSEANKSKKDSTEGVTFLSQLDCSVVLCSCVSASPEVSSVASDIGHNVYTSLLILTYNQGLSYYQEQLQLQSVGTFVGQLELQHKFL